MDKLCIHRVYVAILLLLVSLLATSSGEVVNITDGETLKSYLCSPSGTIPPNTTLFLIRTINLKPERFCLVENTSDITIAAFPHSYAAVNCRDQCFGIGFFNVTNLTITSINFFMGPISSIPPSAVRYINNTYQFLYYNNETRAGIILNHCSNVTVYDCLISTGDTCIGILGVNLCGYNNITFVTTFSFLMSVLFYYEDSDLTSSSDECYLRIVSNGFNNLPFKEDLSSKPKRMPVSVNSGFALVMTQQRFNANVDISIVTGLDEIIPIVLPGSGLIFFVNSITDSHVTFQGVSYNYCLDEHFKPHDDDYPPLALSVLFTRLLTSTLQLIIPSNH